MKLKKIRRKQRQAEIIVATTYKAYYIDYRIFSHKDEVGFARVGVDYTYKNDGNKIFDEQETDVTFLGWIEKFKRMIKTKIYELPVNYNELEINQKRAVRLQYIKQQCNCCKECGESLHKEPAIYIQNAHIHWEAFPKNFQKHPIHLHHDHKTGMTIGAVHMKCNAFLWQFKGE